MTEQRKPARKALTKPKRHAVVKKDPPKRSRAEIALDLLLDKAYRYKQTSNSRKLVDTELSGLRSEILEAMGSDDHKEGEVNGELVSITVVRPTSLEYDEAAIREEVGEAMWKKLTRPVFDPQLLADAVSNAEVDRSVVARHVKTVSRSPYPRIS